MEQGPPHVCMFPLHVKCLHVLYDSYGPPYLTWNRYHMFPSHVYMVPLHEVSSCLIWLMVPHTLYGIGIWWSPLTLYGTGIVWSPTYMHGLPTCIIWLLQSPNALYGIGVLWSLYLIWNRVPTCMCVSPTCDEVSSCLIWLLWSPIPYME